MNFIKKKYERISYDNPNIKQALLTQMFISSANDLFNKGKPRLIEYNGQLNDDNKSDMKLEGIHNTIMRKNEGASKNKEDNVGYYSMEVNGNDGDLDNIGEYSLIDTYSTVNNRLPRFTHILPVQCMKIDAHNLLCVHGDIIYRLRLPPMDFTEDDIGQLIETIYKEIELKHKSTFSNKLHKREINGVTNFGKYGQVFPQNDSPVLTFSLPLNESDEVSSIENNEDDGQYVENFTKICHYLQPKDSPPLDFLSQENNNMYSSKWLSKRELNVYRKCKQNIKRRRVIPPKCTKHLTTERRSVNEGKTGKCHLPKSGNHICFIKTPCPCTYVWPQMPDRTTCPPQPPLLAAEPSTRCPAYRFTAETCSPSRHGRSTTERHTTEGHLTTEEMEESESTPCLVEQYHRKKSGIRRMFHPRKHHHKKYIVKSTFS